jgi:hypothetical protein
MLLRNSNVNFDAIIQGLEKEILDQQHNVQTIYVNEHIDLEEAKLDRLIKVYTNLITLNNTLKIST